MHAIDVYVCVYDLLIPPNAVISQSTCIIHVLVLSVALKNNNSNNILEMKTAGLFLALPSL